MYTCCRNKVGMCMYILFFFFCSIFPFFVFFIATLDLKRGKKIASCVEKKEIRAFSIISSYFLVLHYSAVFGEILIDWAVRFRMNKNFGIFYETKTKFMGCLLQFWELEKIKKESYTFQYSTAKRK